MSNPEQKKEAAEARWEAAQLQAANAQRELDYAIAVFEQNKDELDQDTVEGVYSQINSQKESIKEFVMKSYSAYSSAIKEYEFKVGK
jgi:chorismate mutase